MLLCGLCGLVSAPRCAGMDSVAYRLSCGLLGVYARCAYDRKRLGLVWIDSHRIGGGNRAGQRDTRHSTTSTSGSTGARAGWRIGGQSAGQTMQGMIL